MGMGIHDYDNKSPETVKGVRAPSLGKRGAKMMKYDPFDRPDDYDCIRGDIIDIDVQELKNVLTGPVRFLVDEVGVYLSNEMINLISTDIEKLNKLLFIGEEASASTIVMMTKFLRNLEKVLKRK